VADLGVTVLLTQGVAEVPCAVLIGGGVLPRGRGADNVVAGHRSFALVCLSVNPPPAVAGRGCAVSELDLLQRGSVIQEVCDVLLFDLSSQGLQNLQDLIPIASTAEQGDGKVAGHDVRGCGVRVL